jgi:hypothetical protein
MRVPRSMVPTSIFSSKDVVARLLEESRSHTVVARKRTGQRTTSDLPHAACCLGAADRRRGAANPVAKQGPPFEMIGVSV